MTTRIISTPAITRNRWSGGALRAEHHQPSNDHQDEADAGGDQPFPVALKGADQALDHLAADGHLAREPCGLQGRELTARIERRQRGADPYRTNPATTKTHDAP